MQLYYRWSAQDLSGKQQAGFIVTKHRLAAQLKLIDAGFSDVRLRLALPVVQLFGVYSSRLKVELFSEWAILMAANLSVLEAIDLLITNFTKPLGLTTELKLIRHRLLQGQSLADALKATHGFSAPLITSVVHLGEHTGRLDESFQLLATQFRQQQTLKATWQSMLTYPFILLMMALMIGGFLIGYVIPQFATFYHQFNEPLPGLTMQLLRITEWINTQSGTLLMMTVSCVLLGASQYHGVKLFVKRWLRLLPVTGPLIQMITAWQFAERLRIVLTAGVPLTTAVEIVMPTLNIPALVCTGRSMVDELKNGQPFHHALKKSGLFSEWFISLVKIGEASGTLERMLFTIETHYREKTFRQLKQFFALIEPVIIVGMGALIGMIVVALYLPMFSLGTNL